MLKKSRTFFLKRSSAVRCMGVSTFVLFSQTDLFSHAALAQPRGSGLDLSSLNEEIQQNPRDANALVNRAVYYMMPPPGSNKPPLKNLDLAIHDLEDAIKIEPNNFFARHNYGHAAYLASYDDIAVEEFTKAIAINPMGSARSYMGRGWALVESCKTQQAIPDFDQAVRLDPSLRSEVANGTKIAQRNQECAALESQAQIISGQQDSGGMPNMGKLYEETERNRRISEANSRGDHEAARIIGEQGSG